MLEFAFNSGAHVCNSRLRPIGVGINVGFYGDSSQAGPAAVIPDLGQGVAGWPAEFNSIVVHLQSLRLGPT